MKKYIFILLLCFMGLMEQSANAQSAGTIIDALHAIRASLDAMVNTAATYIFQTPPNIGTELVTNNTLQNVAVQNVPTNVTTLSNQDLLNGLTPDTKNPNKNLTTLATIQASDTVLPSLTVGGIPVPFFSSAVQQNLQNALVQGNQNFNFQSLITPPSYTTQDMQNYALNYIRFISGYAVPISNLNLNSYPESQLSSKQKLEIQNSANYQLYAVQRRQLLATQSAALSNLYWIYSRRLPITKIQPSDTALGVASPSAAQIEDYNATWRISSPTWYTQMSTASQTNVEREILFVLAEMRAEIHRLNQVNERILALTAINQLSGLGANKQMLAIVEKQVQDNINAQLKTTAQKGTSSSAAGPAQQSAEQQSKAQQLQESEEVIKAQQQYLKEQARTSGQNQ